MRKFIVFFGIMIISFSGISHLSGQATIKVMQYNLLYYGQTSGDCTTSNNSVTDKNGYLKTIIDYVLPDIFTVNEMVPNMTYVQSLLNNVMNTSGRTYYQNGPFTNWAGSNIVNMVYYNSDKLTLYNTDYIFHSLRDISVYEFYYNSPDLTQGDTAYISCIVAHLKAGNTSSDEVTRDEMTSNIMTYVVSQGTGKNYLLMGDFNTYTSSEEAIKNVAVYPSAPYIFHDPINTLGDWNNNSYYANVHTQSTHTVSGCAAGGGLDDRFDFIWISDNIYNDVDKVSYINNSYHIIGQDGNHYNNAVNSGTNQDVSATIADALYGMSDHLPVLIQLNIEQTPVDEIKEVSDNMRIVFTNPIKDNLSLMLFMDQKEYTSGILTIYTVSGSVILNKNFDINCGKAKLNFNIENISSGIYYICFRINDKRTIQKIVKL